MNLIPIDAGGTPTELIGGDASPGGDFAALMTGLMAGDTQIVPLIDFPPGQQLPDGAETAEGDETTDVAASILEFVGTPPSGLTISPRVAEVSPNAPADVTDESIESPEIEGEPLSITSALSASVVANPKAAATTGPADGPALATVHPISSQMGNDLATPPAGVVDSGDARQQPDVGPVANEAAPQAPVSPNENRLRATQASSAGIDPHASTVATVDASTQQHLIEPHDPPVPRLEPLTAETHVIQSDQVLESDVELDTGVMTRPPEAARPTGAISQPAMLGIARRVEEAIAALATKPDPKVVTLQLDELDGLRLTVALRPDGLHLSSSGDTALTNEIERALATRGFDMASGSGRGKQGADENPDDGWRPETASAGRTRQTNEPGIRL